MVSCDHVGFKQLFDSFLTVFNDHGHHHCKIQVAGLFFFPLLVAVTCVTETSVGCFAVCIAS